MGSSAPPELERRLQTRLQGDLRPPGGRILYVAYSGGGDSTALLVALLSLGYGVHALHVDHGWHPDSAQWARFCQQQAVALGAFFTLLRLPADTPGEGPEDQARRARYALMAAQLAQGDWLFTAQHLEDQAETLLLQLLRGAGVAGLAAMPAQRPLGAGLLVRPLLDVPQRVLRDYLEQRRLPFLNDPANADVRYDRVRVRNVLLPQLRDLGWPHAAANIARAADNLADMREIAEDWFALRWQRYRADYPELSAERLSLAYLQSLSAAAQRVFLRGWLRKRQISVPSRERLEALQDTIAQGRGGARIQWEGGEAWLQGGLLRTWPQPRATAEKEWEEGPWCAASEKPLPIPGWQCALRDTSPDGFHHALAERFAETSLYWRRRRQGEITLTGQGQHRPLKKLLLEAGVPPDQRADVPLLWDEAGHLLLILGYYTSPWASAPHGSTALCLWNAGTQSAAGKGVGST